MSDTNHSSSGRRHSKKREEKKGATRAFVDDDDDDYDDQDLHKDFDDHDHDDFSSAGNQQQRSIFDDDDDDDDGPVDINKFMLGRRSDSPSIPSRVSVPLSDIDETEEDIDEEEEYDAEEDYETDEEEEEMADDLLGPSDEFRLIETTSQEQLNLQLEHNKRMAKEKKQALIKEYLQEIKHYYQLRRRNACLAFKITSNIDQTQQIVDKYLQMRINDIEKAREVEMLKKLHILESNQILAGKKEMKERAPRRRSKKKNRKSKSKRKSSGEDDPSKPKAPRQTRFFEEDSNKKKELIPAEVLQAKHDLTLGEIQELYTHTVQKATKKRMKLIQKCDDDSEGAQSSKGNKVSFNFLPQKEKNNKRKRSSSKQAARFTFNRSMFLGDVIFRKSDMGRRSKLMNLRFSSQLDLRKTWASTSTHGHGHTHRFSRNSRRRLARRKPLRFFTTEPESKFKLSKEARQLSKSKSRMALDQEKGSRQNQKILIETAKADLKDLNHFKFEFSGQRLSAKLASVKLREETLGMLKHRRVPTQQLTWPMEVKGTKYSTKNPYGRIVLNYTRPSHHEKEHPYTAYRLVLTNIAFFRVKEQRLAQLHSTNRSEMEEELEQIVSGVQQIIFELIEAFRIWASLSGVTCREHYEAKRETEKFIEYFRHVFDNVLLGVYVELYEAIQSNEFALRRLSVSEGKGEGAELHEFKDIMRCREKLKAEHRTVQKHIFQYQSRCSKVLNSICKTDATMRSISENIDMMSEEVKRFKGMLKSICEGLHFCQSVSHRQKHEEKKLLQQRGILMSPALTRDYEKMLERKTDDRIKRQQLSRKYNSSLRQIQKMKLGAVSSLNVLFQ